MPDPYDYTSTFANVPSPNAAILQGVQGGATLAQLQNQAQQQSAALAQQQQKQQFLQSLVNNPNAGADDYAKATVVAPELHAQFKQAWDMKSAAQQQADLSNATQWSSAIQSGQPQIASQSMRDQADAIENTAGGPTPSSKALRAKADQVDANPQAANVILKSMIYASPNGPKVVDAIVASNKDQREQDLAPAAVQKAGADATSAQDDAALKGQQITAQKAGALAKVVTKPDQVAAFLQSERKAGRIAPDDPILSAPIPTDPKALPDFLNSIMTSGIKPDDQQKYLAPTADAKLQSDTSVQTTGMNNATSVRTTGMNNSTQVQVQKMIGEREDSKEGDVDPKQVENVSDLIASGRMAPLGAMAMRTPFGQAVMSRVAEKNPNYRAQDFGTSSKAEKDFATGKLGSSVRSFNVGLSHLDTLGQLADAMGNKDTQAVNRIGNYFATQTGSDAPVKFEAAKKVVTDEIVKAIVGAGGTGHDREEAAKTVSSASSPAQLRGVINTYKDLMVGQLGGLDQQYRTTTGRDDFHKYLSPQALTLYGKHGGSIPAPAPAAAVPTLPTGWSVQVH